MSQYLNTDLYEVTMALGYLESGKGSQKADFELFFRKLPDKRNYVVAAGVDRAVEFAANFSIDGEDIDYLSGLEDFSHIGDDTWAELEQLPPPDEIRAVREGEILFHNQPLISLRGALPTVQLLETPLISLVHYPSCVASKAARVCRAAGTKKVLEFGMRRAPMLEAADEASRVSYMAGADGVSNTAAGRNHDIPVAGTMAHSWVMSFDDEEESFQTFLEAFPDLGVLLIETWGVEHGVDSTLAMDPERVKAVRIDSGDLVEDTKWVREKLDENGYEDTEIILSGNLDEYKIHELEHKHVPVDSYGVGTEMVNSSDSPKIGFVYKLVAIEDEPGSGDWRPTIKVSEDKQTWPWAKQVKRKITGGSFERDTVCKLEEAGGFEGEELLALRWSREEGWLRPPEKLEDQRQFTMLRLKQLPQELHSLEEIRDFYSVEFSDRIDSDRERLEAEHSEQRDG